MRFDWFLPSPRSAEKGDARLGWGRRVLHGLGPTWAASPLRRVVQTLALVVFFYLFLYVCWPYTATPAFRWANWLPAEVDVETGGVTLLSEQPPDDLPALLAGSVVHVSDAGTGQDEYLGRFEVRSVAEQELALVPVEPLDRKELDRLSTSFGPWTLSESKPGSWPSHYTDDFHAKQTLAAEAFLVLDPLASISAAVAARTWVWSLWCAGAILLICLVVPRGFCAYVCPLGTMIDLFDWAVGRRLVKRRKPTDGWWVQVKYFLLTATLTAALFDVVLSGFALCLRLGLGIDVSATPRFGVLFSGYVGAIPVVTRAMAFVLTPLETGLARGWHQVPAMGAGHVLSLGLFCAILGLGLLRPRFWCKYVCPTGAVFSLANFFRLTERKVEATCTGCRRCVKICPFDAIEPDFSTRTADCTFCQACGGVCPTRSIKFVTRWHGANLKRPLEPKAGESPLRRRGFLATVIGLSAGAYAGMGLFGVARLRGAKPDDGHARPIVRPPGSVPERQFLGLCVRCGECFQACPNDVLQPVGLDQGLERLWTPQVVADWSGCEPSCSNCGQVCPTGAIRPLPLEEKRAARMGLAVVDRNTCLPYAGREECQLCVDECATAGYDAIEFVHTGTEMDASGQPIEGTGFLAPVVLEEKCVGCGLCQTRCYAINSKAKGLLAESAVRVEAGPGKEDRLLRGSYVALRDEEQRKREEERRKLLGESGAGEDYLPDFLKQ
ncbi:MAG: 4Fe-4S binding protein [Planctomycetes bacterium]|nr:4Fe-4S binding protein [Planctomycetota bacterium]